MSSRRAITVRLPGSADHAVHFDGAELTVGRSPDNDVCLPDRGVSRRHARIFEQGGLWIESTTPVASLVQHGQPVVRCRFDAGPVGIGPYTLSLEAPAVAGARAATPGDVAQARSALLAKIVEALDLRMPVSRYLESLLDTLLGYLQAERAFLFRFDATGVAGMGQARRSCSR